MKLILNVRECTQLCVAILLHHLVCVCTPPHLCLCCHTLSSSPSLLCFHTKFHPINFVCHSSSHSFSSTKSIPFILLIIFHLFHGYHIWSYSCYIVIQPYFHDRSRNTILLTYIHLWADIKTYVSKADIVNITILTL